jgi:hypothetical protein
MDALGKTAEVYKDVRLILDRGIFRIKFQRNSATEFHFYEDLDWNYIVSRALSLGTEVQGCLFSSGAEYGGFFKFVASFVPLVTSRKKSYLISYGSTNYVVY